MGRIMNALLLMTSPDTTIFAPENVGWYNSDGTEVVGIKVGTKGQHHPPPIALTHSNLPRTRPLPC